jgi:signal transduction histidine kinase/DNA-binding response OmpR family regulator
MDAELVHILLVEDEESHAELIRRAFKSRPEPSALTVARNLREARSYLAKSSPDLVIVDLLLPDGKGIELLRNGQEQSSFPAIIMTSYGNEQLAVEAMKAGALDYVVKSEVTLADMPWIAKRALREWGHIIEHKRAEREIRQRNRELALLNQVIAVSAASLEPETVLKTVCFELAQTLDLPLGLAVLLNEEKTALVVVAEYLAEAQPSLLRQSFPLTHIPFLETFIKHRQPLFFEDARNDPRLASLPKLLRRHGAVSIILFPLIVEGKIVGGLNLAATKRRLFSVEEISLIGSVAEQVASGLARIQLTKERRRLEAEYYQSQKLESVGRLAAGIAHDFNNLLTAINGFAELLQAELVPEANPQQELVSKILDAGQRASDLVRQLLAFSRKQFIEPQVFNLNTKVTKIEQMLQRIIGEDIKLETVLAPELWPIKTDPTHIEQVILNLAVNARDAMPGGGHLLIETSNIILNQNYATQYIGVHPGKYILLTITDSGHGMSQAVKEHIFEPFFTTKEIGKGTGLGLATVFGIVKQNGGNILVESEEGLGTTFRIYLPSSTETALSPIEVEAKLSVLPGHETILIVEDDAEVRGLTRRILQRQGYTLLEVQNGQEALQLVAQYSETIHLVLTDMIMPGINGKVLAEGLLRLRPELKIIFMSGYTDNLIAEPGDLNSRMAFVQKPFNAKTLVQKIQAALDN